MAGAPLLELRGHHQALPGTSSPTTASTSTCASGEVHALLGENGAGKSTLMNILYGLYHPDEGEIVIERQAGAHSTRRATRSTRGIGMVHQHFMLIPVMTVAENIVLGAEPTQGRRSSTRRGRATACASSAERFGLAGRSRRADRGRSASACSSASRS